MAVIDVKEKLDALRNGVVQNVIADIKSKITEDAISAVGVLMVPGTGDNQVKLPTVTGDIAKGVGVLVYDAQHMLEANGDVYAADRPVPLLSMGQVAVAVEDAVTRGNQPFVRHANGTLGAFRSDADGGDATALSNARFVTSTSGAGVAVVELNLPL